MSNSPAETPTPKKPETEDQTVTTRHTITINNTPLHYTVTCGTLVLKEEAEKDGKSEGEKARARVFFTAYGLEDEKDPKKRPITFSFNGGPGSSSVWLHMGLLGPKRVLLDDEGFPLPPPYKLVDNEATLLTHSDLVFIDPVGTGFSRMLPGEDPHDYHSFSKDIESVGEFIRLYCTRYNRWASAKYLIGESYGTTRAAGLSEYLQERYGMYLNGVMLVSSILSFITARFTPGNDLPYLLFLPSYTATAWYHKRLPSDLQNKPLVEVLEEVENFVTEEYLPALMAGDELPAEQHRTLRHSLSRYTGLTPAYIEHTDLRINIHRFVKELLRADGRTLGRLDSRYKGYDRDSAGENHEHDPSYTAIAGAYTATFNDYVRRELDYQNDLPYEVLSFKVFPAWKYDKQENEFTNVAESLRKAMATNPALRIHVANGYYDLATPYFATEYTFKHLGLPAELRKNIEMSYYEAGHMMYVHKTSLRALGKTLRDFVSAK
ncbi:MAG: peptidase S10 [Anaerolineales bacterium]